MKHIVFDSVDDLFKFILARRAAGGRRSLFCETIFFGEKDYRLNFEPGDWDGAGDIFGGRISEGRAPGRSMSVSELLEHVLLQRVSADFNSGASSIVLAMPVSGQGGSAAQQILYDAWRQVERVDWARSAFHLCKTPAGGGWHAVQIDGVAPGFNFVTFRQAHRAKFEKHGLRVFAPAWNSAGCCLYVEWGYRYPRAAEFAQLHRESSTQLILCDAVREAQTREARRSWWVPGWHVLDAEAHYTVSDLFEIAPPHSITTARYLADTTEALAKVTLPLEIGPVGEAVASARDLELRIGSLKRELESLTGKSERLQRVAHQEFFAIYRWRQEPHRGALPTGLEHLLGKPLSELNRYLYLQTRDEDGATIHYVAHKDHQTAAMAAAVLCDRCYLCDTRWLAWRLPLFVRQGQAVKIDINEEEMAGQILTAVPPEPGGSNREQEGEVFCLMEQSEEEGVPAFTWLTFSSSLDEAFTVTNGRAAGPRAALRAAAHEVNGTSLSQDIAISEAALDLDTTTRDRAANQLQAVEDGWESTRRNLQAAAFQVRVAELAARPLAEARDALTGSWSQFLQRALEADAAAVKFKIEALGNWAASEPARKDLLLQHEQGLVDVEAAIRLRRAEYEALLPRITARNESLVAECSQLDQKLQQVRQEESTLAQSGKALTIASAGLESQIGALEERIRLATQEITRHANLREQLTACALREGEVQIALKQGQDELHEALLAFRNRLTDAHDLENRVAVEYSAREAAARADDGFFKSISRKFFGGGDKTGRRRR